MMIEPDWIEQSIRRSYFGLRLAIATLGVIFPILLFGGGALAGCAVQTSLSAWFHTPVSDLFVGMLFLIAGPLYLYKGYLRRENFALNVAAIGAVIVALFPTTLPATAACLPDPVRDPQPVLHAIGAFAFFFGGAFVCLFCSGFTVDRLPPDRQARYRHFYRLCGVVMLASPIVALALTMTASRQPYFVLVVELLGIFTLSAYWAVKTHEIWWLLRHGRGTALA